MRLRPFRKKTELAPGEDSFLDIVCNLVGVLIILVVVVGANAGSKIREIAISQVDQRELTDLEKQSAVSRRTAMSLQQNNYDLEQKIQREQQLADQRQVERQRFLVQIETARQQLESRKRNLTAEQQEFLAHSNRVGELQRQLTETRAQIDSLTTINLERQTIEHYPTPIAKTVFSDELHFRLRDGRLVHVPMNELVDLMKNEWKEKAKKLDVASETLETVGPVGDFRLQYQLRAEEETAVTSYGELSRRTPRFTRFVLVPVSDSIGSKLDEALQDNSAFRRLLDPANPEKTTISVWVYPDSFSEFNQLKSWLYKRGFKTACWPLSRNSPISGGPSGYRSTAQ